MFEEIKERLLEQPESIRHILDAFGFYNIKINSKEIRAAFEPGMNPMSIAIRLQNNPNLFVKDYGRNISMDLINYLVNSKGIAFKDVMSAIKKELNLESIYNYTKTRRRT